MENVVYDTIIIGAGPAGIAAAIYAKRAGLNFLIFKNKYSIDSQITQTYEIDNYIGYFDLSGQELYDKFVSHLKHFNIEIINEKIISVDDLNSKIKKVFTKVKNYNTKTIVLATGAKPKLLGIDRESDFVGNGVSYCATCDGVFFKDKIVAVVGGGNVALEDAIYLSRVCSKVYLLVRKEYFRADDILQKQVSENEKIEVLFNTVVDSINGETEVKSINVIQNDENKKIDIDGLFVAIGITPESDLLKDKVMMVDDFVATNESCKTILDGVYACGDVRNKNLRQVITACADGAIAIDDISKVINR